MFFMFHASFASESSFSGPGENTVLSRSATLQIDGETIPDVTEYTVSSAKKKVLKYNF